MFLSPEIKKLNFDIYIRRSSDDNDHQIASIEQQRNQLTKFALEEGLKVNEILEESQSAKQPGRLIFNKLIEKIQKGLTNGVIVWDLSRLSRNPIDSGNLSWLLQQGMLKAIITPFRVYLSEDNVLLLNIEFGQANQYVIDLSKNIRRGLANKLEAGWRPGVAPEGYINDNSHGQGKSIIIPDSKRFSLVRKMWDLMLTGSYTVPQILKIVNEEWGYRTRKGNKISRSGLYHIFTNPFYYGEYEYGKKWYVGKHQPMITKEEYDRVQSLLGKKGKQRPKTREFAFTGMIRCGECGAMITAEEKINRYGKRYIYYHCTKRINPNCSQKSIELKELEKQIDELLAKIEIPEEFKDWAIKYLNELHDKEEIDQKAILKSLDDAYSNCIKKINNLISLKISPMNSDGSLLPDEEFERQIKSLQQEKKILEEKKENLGKRINKWVELSQKTFEFACYARERFKNGTIKEKRQILQSLGSNFLLKNKKLHLDLLKPYLLIERQKCEVDKVVKRSEPSNNTDTTTQKAFLFASNPILSKLVDDVRTYYTYTYI